MNTAKSSAIHKAANFSRCKNYRYAFWRTWDANKGFALFIGLNPSTANQFVEDPTTRRCINFARDWGYGGVCVANLFAYRATYPADLLAADEPVGPANNRWLRRLSNEAAITVAAWGNDGTHLGRAAKVKKMISGMHYLKLNQSGEPAHPLYIQASARPMPLSS